MKSRQPHPLGGDIATAEDSSRFVPLHEEALPTNRVCEHPDLEEWCQYGQIDGATCTLYWVTEGPPQWATPELDAAADRVVWECAEWGDIPTPKPTIARQIEAAMCGDGQVFEAPDGTPLDTLCRRHAYYPDWQHGHGTDTLRYVFDDGSAIVISCACWDVRADGCKEYCMAGEPCQCPDREGAA